jgi:uncharacterized protein YfaS (alpha-2-macroglobulin family)
LVREAQLLVGQGQFENAAEFFSRQALPTEKVPRAAVELARAALLSSYVDANSWQLRQRERVAEAHDDVRLMTADQIQERVLASFLAAWGEREALGKLQRGSFYEVFEANDYPLEVRGTVRDSLSYVFVETLGNTSWWSPRQTRDVFRLDVSRLLANEAAWRQATLASPDAHPLERLAAVLGDLEAWHASAGRRAASLEARRVLARRLAQAFERDADKRAIREDFARRLEAFRQDPWWAMGVATLAEMLRDEPREEAWAEARDTAQRGAAAYPASAGAKECRGIVLALEHAEIGDFSSPRSLPERAAEGSAAGSARESFARLAIESRNLRTLHLRAFPVDVAGRLESGRSPWPEYQEMRGLLDGKPARSWTIDLPATPLLRLTPSTHALDLPSGGWAIFGSVRPDFADENNVLRSVFVVAGDLALLARGATEEPGVVAVAAASGVARAGVDVAVYRNDYQARRYRKVSSARTGADGWAPLTGDQNYGMAVLARQGSDIALLDGMTLRQGVPQSAEHARSLIFTDRAIYRPGQTILWKVLVYEGSAETLRGARGTPVSLSLVDPNGETVATAGGATNDFGTASGELVIPPSGRLLGSWSLRSSADGWARVRVEEYKRPTFEVKFVDPEAPLRLNQPAKFAGEARYYFGLPLSSGAVTWKVLREPVMPPFWECACWGWWIRPAREEIVASGESAVGAGGRFPVEFTPLADERLADDRKVSYRYRIEASVTDEGGETREAKRSFRLGFSAVEARVDLGRDLRVAGSASVATLERSDLSGTPRAGDGRWRLVELTQPARPVLPGERLREGATPRGKAPGARGMSRRGGVRAPESYDPAAELRRWEDGAEITSQAVTHARGPLEIHLPALAPGAYRIRYTTRDEFGVEADTQAEFVVAGPVAQPRTPLALALDAEVESPTVEVGGTARLFVHSGLAEPRVLVETYRALELRSRRWLDTQGGSAWIELPIGPDDRGGFSVRVSTVREHREMALIRSVDVPWSDRGLDLSFKTFRDTLRPKARETWTVVVSDAKGKPVEAGAAEVLAAMYDKSLDVFAPHQIPLPINLFPGRAGTPWAASSFGTAQGMWLGQGLDVPMDGGEFSPDTFRTIWTWYGQGIRGGVEGGVAGGVPGGVVAETAMLRAAPAAAPKVQAMVAADATSELEEGRAEGRSAADGTAQAPAVEVRSDFRETAFWEPNLLTQKDGSVAIEFEVPDSVTSWKVWLSAIGRDFASGALEAEARTVKELLVRPYLPRYLREGDRAEIAVAVNNSGKKALSGEVRLGLTSADDGADWLARFGVAPDAARRPFTVPAGGSTTVIFPLITPKELGQASLKVEAVAGSLGDGEVRALPVLPSRLHLAQSRFAMLKGAETRELVFADLLRGDDRSLTSEQMVVTVDGQLFYSILDALPYLVEYPYECSEQTLNRFLSTGILTGLFDRYPAVAEMARQLSQRETQFEAFGAVPDPNRKMALEETPWLRQSRGQGSDLPLVNVLDPRIALAQRKDSLARLASLQQADGAFPWFPGGPPSDYMTLYVLYGFAKAAEFEIDVPRPMVEKGWRYLKSRYRAEWKAALRKKEASLEFLTLLNYVASTAEKEDRGLAAVILDAEDRREILDASFAEWRRFAPGMKGLLALTLNRAGRRDDALQVYESVMDAAKTTRDEGTFWAPEERSWLWFNDTIEGHAFVLRVLAELRPDDPRRPGMLQWLFLNKKLNHWKSTRATAEVLYAVAYALDRDGEIAQREEVNVTVGGRRSSFVFEPDRYTGKKNQIVITGDKVGPAEGRVVVETVGGNPERAQTIASATWHFATDRLPAEASGDLFHVERRYFRRVARGEEMVLEPLAADGSVGVGDEIEVQLSIVSRQWAEYVHLRDPRPAGFEPGIATSGYRWDLGLARYEEVRDAANNFFFERLPAGEYTLKYRVRAATAGVFRSGPAQLQSMYAPEFTAYSSGREVEVRQQPALP